MVFLSGGPSGLCAGWEPTPEARMACCLDEATCPMHHKSSATGRAGDAVTQAQADSCCAASDGDDSAASASAFVPVVSLGPVTSPISDAGSPPDAWLDSRRDAVPLPGSHVPKHLLLSVFLI